MAETPRVPVSKVVQALNDTIDDLRDAIRNPSSGAAQVEAARALIELAVQVKDKGYLTWDK